MKYSEKTKPIVLLADDDRFICKWVKQVTETTLQDNVKVIDVHDGGEALHVIRNETNQIDIAILDIEMPVASGLEVASELKKKFPMASILMLTCFSDFHYAREGIDIGISRYLIKDEVTEEKLKEILLEEYAQSLQRYKDETIDHGSDYTLSDFLEKLYRNEVTEQQCQQVFRSNHLQVGQQIGIICIPNNSYITANQVHEFFLPQKEKQYPDVHLVHFLKKYLIIVFNYKKSRNEFIYYASKELQKLLNQVQVSILMELKDYDFNEPFLEKFREILKKCVYYGDASYFYSEKKLMLLNYEPQRTEPEKDAEIDTYFKKLNEINDPEILEECAKNYFDLVRKKEYQNKEAVLFALMNLFHHLEFHHGPLEYTVADLRETPNFEEAYKMTLYNIRHIHSEYQVQYLAEDQIIQKVIGYIEDHYADRELNQEKIGKIFFINKSYFSYLFKKNTGINYVDFLINYRMKKAKELLTVRSKSISEIAMEVGYDSLSSFSRTFKKSYHMTPQEYRKSLKL